MHLESCTGKTSQDHKLLHHTFKICSATKKKTQNLNLSFSPLCFKYGANLDPRASPLLRMPDDRGEALGSRLIWRQMHLDFRFIYAERNVTILPFSSPPLIYRKVLRAHHALVTQTKRMSA